MLLLFDNGHVVNDLEKQHSLLVSWFRRDSLIHFAVRARHGTWSWSYVTPSCRLASSSISASRLEWAHGIRRLSFSPISPTSNQDSTFCTFLPVFSTKCCGCYLWVFCIHTRLSTHCRTDEFLHLSGIHGQGFLNQNILYGLHEELAGTQVVMMDCTDVHHLWKEEERCLTVIQSAHFY